MDNIVLKWVYWHFFEASRSVLRVWGNYLRFGLNYFSVPMLLKTWFAPWRRYQWSYGKGFQPQKFFEVLVSNVISRTLGFLMRSVLIVTGIVVELLMALAGFVAFLAWLVLPALLLLGIYHGIRLSI